MMKSKIAATAALFVIVAVVVVTLAFHAPWWCLIAEFFAFMAAEAHFAALLIGNKNPYAYRKLEKSAMILGILFILSIIALFIVFQINS